MLKMPVPASDGLIEEGTVPGVDLGVRLDGHQAQGVVLQDGGQLDKEIVWSLKELGAQRHELEGCKKPPDLDSSPDPAC